jgi:hypothetical protein
VGENSAAGSITNSSATGTVSGGSSSDIGGLVGYSLGTVSVSYAGGPVSGVSANIAGGLIGFNSGTVSQTFATGSVSAGQGNSDAGGLIGEASSASSVSISNSYATGSVAGGANVGGLIGLNAMNVSDVYSTGKVTGNGNLGGLIGQEDYGYTTITNGYWNTASGPANGIGLYQLASGGTDPEPTVTGLTLTQLETSMPSGFDTSIWGQSSTYQQGLPYLLSLYGD